MVIIQTTSLIYDRSAVKLAVAAQVFSERASRAESLEMTIPSVLLLRADEVIE